MTKQKRIYINIEFPDEEMRADLKELAFKWGRQIQDPKSGNMQKRALMLFAEDIAFWKAHNRVRDFESEPIEALAHLSTTPHKKSPRLETLIQKAVGGECLSDAELAWISEELNLESEQLLSARDRNLKH